MSKDQGQPRNTQPPGYDAHRTLVGDMNHQDSCPVRLVVAISSRALFDLGASHQVFETQGVEVYCRYQIDHEEEVLEPGVAFPTAKKLLALDERLGERGQVELTLLSRNSSDTGLRVFNSIRHYELDITRVAFTGGCSPYSYVSAFGTHLFLSADPNDAARPSRLAVPGPPSHRPDTPRATRPRTSRMKPSKSTASTGWRPSTPPKA